MKQLRDRVALVTGGGSGIGRGMALAFADSGMHVVIADIEEDAARKVAGEVEQRGVRSLPVQVDVTDRAAVEALAERSFAELGAVHVLCNNAGVAVFGPLDQMSDEDWRFVLSVNLEGVVHGLQAFLPRMRELEGEKHVVNTASGAGLIAFPTLGVYTATKYAVVGISETLRADVAAPTGSASRCSARAWSTRASSRASATGPPRWAAPRRSPRCRPRASRARRAACAACIPWSSDRWSAMP